MTADRSNALIVGCLGIVVAGTLAIAAVQDRSEARPPADPLTPYENCILAANDPGPSGFAGEVCEPLRGDWTEPVVTLRPDDFRADGCVRFRYLPDDPEPVVYCPEEGR